MQRVTTYRYLYCVLSFPRYTCSHYICRFSCPTSIYPQSPFTVIRRNEALTADLKIVTLHRSKGTDALTQRPRPAGYVTTTKKHIYDVLCHKSPSIHYSRHRHTEEIICLTHDFRRTLHKLRSFANATDSYCNGYRTRGKSNQALKHAAAVNYISSQLNVAVSHCKA